MESARWVFPFAILTDLVGIAYYSVHNKELADPETVFIVCSNILFHPYITGFLLAAILAAIMSMISSQLLVTSSTMTEDFYKAFFRRHATDKELVLIGRLAGIAAFLSIAPSDTILNLVGYAWAGFGSAFGPAILLSLYWKRMTKWGALVGMIVGSVTVFTWVNVPALKDLMYEMIPGFFLSLLAAVSLLTKEPSEKVQDTFEEMEETMIEEAK